MDILVLYTAYVQSFINIFITIIASKTFKLKDKRRLIPLYQQKTGWCFLKVQVKVESMQVFPSNCPFDT